MGGKTKIILKDGVELLDLNLQKIYSSSGSELDQRSQVSDTTTECTLLTILFALTIIAITLITIFKITFYIVEHHLWHSSIKGTGSDNPNNLSIKVQNKNKLQSYLQDVKTQMTECHKIFNIGKSFITSNNETLDFRNVSDNSIFFIKDDGIMTDQDACSLESALKLFPKKDVYSLQMNCHRPPELEDIDYRQFLKINYTNLKMVEMEGDDLFKDTLLKGKWSCDSNLTMFDAKVLILWLLGGAVISHEVLLGSPLLLQSNLTLISPQVLFVDSKCSPILYKLLNRLKKESSDSKNLNKIITSSHCSKKIGEPVMLLSQKHFCNHASRHCAFIKIEGIKKSTAAWPVILKQFCPVIIENYQTNLKPGTMPFLNQNCK